jgi:hypothetical protein
MQHIFEFVAVKKLTVEEEMFNKDVDNIEKKIPEIIHRYFNSKSSRKSKVTEEIYKALKKAPFNISDSLKDLESFLIRQLR